jgi:hypothetical protein
MGFNHRKVVTRRRLTKLKAAPEDMKNARITIEYRSRDATGLLIGLIGLGGLFAAAHVLFTGPFASVETFRRLFNLDGEMSIPTWFATVQLFAIGAAFLLIAYASKYEDQFPPSLFVLGGLFFVFLSADEGGVIHERVGLALTSIGLGSPGYLWILVYIVAGLILLLTAGFYFWRSVIGIWHQFTRESLLILGGFATMVAGGIGAESIFLMFELDGTLYQAEVTIEELLEMTGASIVLYATLEMAAALCSEKSAQESDVHA